MNRGFILHAAYAALRAEVLNRFISHGRTIVILILLEIGHIHDREHGYAVGHNTGKFVEKQKAQICRSFAANISGEEKCVKDMAEILFVVNRVHYSSA